MEDSEYFEPIDYVTHYYGANYELKEIKENLSDSLLKLPKKTMK